MKKLFIFEGFSLVEMLMALLVASLLLAALAPVMTRRMNENLHITGDMTLKGEYTIEEIAFGDSKYCPNIVNDANGNPLYCEGEYVVKEGVSNITVTAIGAGGGGGTAPTAGYIEYTTAGSTNTFTVPAMVNQIEATLVSGGAGGGAGGQVETNVDYLSPGEFTWNVPEIARNKNVLITACGAGGGAGGTGEYEFHGAGGGSGAYALRHPVALDSSSSIFVSVGGGGGGGASFSTPNAANGGWMAGGGGGSDYGYGCKRGTGGGGGTASAGGTGGNWTRVSKQSWGLGGLAGANDNMASNGTDGSNTADGYGRGGINAAWGSNGGNGGQIPDNMNATSCGCYTHGGGGGAGSWYGYAGGGGGGGAWTTGGGGGGGGTLLYIQKHNSSKTLFNIAGGGGGGGAAVSKSSITSDSSGRGASGGGGAGGGGGGGIGGNGAVNVIINATPGGGGRILGGSFAPNNANKTSAGVSGNVGYAGSGGLGGKINTIFGEDRCNGGSASTVTTATGGNGKPGAMRITYLDNGSGASGGGGGQIVPIQKLNVTSNETLNIVLGPGGEGGEKGYINSSGTIISPTNGIGTNPDGAVISRIYRDNNIILATSRGRGWNCAYGGSPTGVSYSVSPWYSCGGWITTGIFDNGNIYLTVPGFSSTNGKSANNTSELNATSYPNGSTGGDGGTVTTPWFTCTPGRGGTKDNPEGGNASGFGCGGGGGYGLSNGGKGAGGYARLSWNMYWDTALNSGKGDYKYADIGTGGGGASGNAITETVRVSEKQVIKIRIGAGGIGAKVVNNEIIPATSGGTTIFGDTNFIEIKAGGGGGGISPTVVKNGDTTTLVNGKGGEPSKICDVGSHKYFNNKNRCTQGKEGKTPGEDNTVITNGGLGGAFSLTVNNKTYTGTGGQGGMQSTEVENSKGKTPESTNVASGGGGAALLIYKDGISNMSQLNNPQGGNGANGRIVLKVWK